MNIFHAGPVNKLESDPIAGHFFFGVTTYPVTFKFLRMPGEKSDQIKTDYMASYGDKRFDAHMSCSESSDKTLISLQITDFLSCYIKVHRIGEI